MDFKREDTLPSADIDDKSYSCEGEGFSLHWDNDVVYLTKEDVEFLIPVMQMWLFRDKEQDYVR